MRHHYTPIRMDKIQNTDNTKYWWECEVTEHSSLLVAMQMLPATLEACLVVSYKTKHTLCIWSSSRGPWYLPKLVENICPHKNLHTDIYRRLIYNCQNLEANNMSFSRWMDKLWYIQTMEYHSVLKRNELPSHEKTWRKRKCMLQRERSQSQKAAYCMIPTMWHSGKGETSVCQGSHGEYWTGRAQKIFRAVKYSTCYYNDGYISLYFCPNP